ncbi:predicted protein [Lichtheimia corymbifera JMRC:FSU:9682]|uniref:F-box domain-containing protein n=1 Tax=Lichtheimia corymbifera JMRC:FSU:9682 TaxID=1263082 RepID=A0A068SFB6_9FUNG|nr:predicted protein [Lichtheimia corymbifera JMRC:FSU:9682]
MTSLSTNFVTVFPSEILGRIFSFLPQHDRIEYARVCRLWREGILLHPWDPHTWRSYDLLLYSLHQDLVLFANVAPYIEELHTYDRTYDDDENPVFVDMDHLAMLTSIALPKIRALDYACFGLRRNALIRLLCHVGAQLERLEIKIEYESDTSWPPCIHEILQHCPLLQHLTYNADFSNDIVIEDFKAADDEPHQVRYPLLQTLELEREDFQTSELLPLLHACPQIRRLHLSCALAWNVDLLSVFDACPALQSLEIDVKKHDAQEINRPCWWKTSWITPPLHDGNLASHGLSHLIVSNFRHLHQFYALNTIVNQHYQTLKHIEVTISHDFVFPHAGRKHEAICNAPPHLEKLDYHFGQHQYTDDDLEFFIRPHLEQCLRLTWVSIKADLGNHHPPLQRWAFEALAQLSDLRHLCIQIPNDPNDMVYFLDTINKRKKVVLSSLLYQGLWLSNTKVIRAIVAIPSLRCLALSVPSIHEHVPRNEMLETLQLLQGAPCIQSLAFANVNGFGPHRVWKEIRAMPNLEQLYIVTYTVTSKKGIRHLARRQPPLKTLVIMELSDDCHHKESDNDLLQTLVYARTKIKIVHGEHDCGKCCQHHTSRKARMYGL